MLPKAACSLTRWVDMAASDPTVVSTHEFWEFPPATQLANTWATRLRKNSETVYEVFPCSSFLIHAISGRCDLVNDKIPTLLAIPVCWWLCILYYIYIVCLGLFAIMLSFQNHRGLHASHNLFLLRTAVVWKWCARPMHTLLRRSNGTWTECGCRTRRRQPW